MPTKQEIEFLEQRWSSCKYKPEFAQMLLNHLSEGYSYSSFDVPGGVTYSTLRQWEKRFPEFAQAREMGEKAKLKLLETEGLKMVKEGNVVAWKFLMNQQGVTEQMEITHTLSTSPHMQVSPEVRFNRYQMIKELHQRAVARKELNVIPERPKPTANSLTLNSSNDTSITEDYLDKL